MTPRASVPLLLLVAALQAAPLQLAVVVRTKGRVEIGPDGATTHASAGSLIVDGSRVRTGDDGRALIRFLADQSIAEIKPRTTVDFAARAGEDGRGLARRLLLRAGEAAFGVTPGKGRDLRFETSTTVASVRGTNFYMVSLPGGSTVVGVDKGVVHVCNPLTGEWIDVHPGERIVSGWDGILPRDSASGDVSNPERDSTRTSTLEVEFHHPVTGSSSRLDVSTKGVR